MSFKQYYKYTPIIALLTCFFLDSIVITTPYWPLTMIVAIIAGFICVEMKWGALTGTLGVLLAWVLGYLYSINDISLQADQLGRLITGSNGAGGMIILIIFIVGALFGFLGGSIGSGIRMLVYPEETVTHEENLEG